MSTLEDGLYLDGERYLGWWEIVRHVQDESEIRPHPASGTEVRIVEGGKTVLYGIVGRNGRVR